MTTNMKPAIHTNGTSPESLLDAYRKLYTAVHAAIDAIADSAPNARDYYPLGADAFQEARTEHAARYAALVSVRNDAESLCEHCQDAIDAKERRNRR